MFLCIITVSMLMVVPCIVCMQILGIRMRQGVLSSGNVLKIGLFVPSYLNCVYFPVSGGDFGSIYIVRF